MQACTSINGLKIMPAINLAVKTFTNFSCGHPNTNQAAHGRESNS